MLSAVAADRSQPLSPTEDPAGHRSMASTVADRSERSLFEQGVDITPRAEQEFQRTLSKAAGCFCAIEPDRIDQAIIANVREIGLALQLDWTALWRWSPASGVPAAQPATPQESQPTGEHSIGPMPSVFTRLESGESCCITTVDELPDPDRAAFRRLGLRSGIVVPLVSDDDRTLSSLVLGSTTQERPWRASMVERVHLVAGIVSQALSRRDAARALQAARDEVRQMRDRALENVELRREIKTAMGPRAVVCESAAIKSVLMQVQQVAPTPSTVLLLGETGTGKEVMAQTIHDLGPRHQRPMIRVSCAAIPSALIESELFGRERGAYTGALSRQIGRFEAANQSTLFLDEIGELPLDVQVKLLRVLQERVIERLGSTQPVKVDVRIIAATNRNLEDAVRDKTFREDLYYRLNVFPIVVPPLRDRVDDIPALVWTFIDEFSRAFGKPIDSISKASLQELQRYPWPGNVRELRNVIERAVIVATGRQLVVDAPRSGRSALHPAAGTLHQVETDHIRTVLKRTGWRVRGSGGAAERLGLKPTTLESRMARLGIARDKPALS